jgi:hypothetical protein
MIDIIYVLVTVVFFALMLAYVRACHGIGRKGADESSSSGETI